ncbi:uncharacterized protein [Solanum tuberosum]|uniref:uncharacterized protein n=1 Tax=Solanum tuberosum TaxID=4113 RepID=UPI00073A207D|nr:PREDICTED: uncharacterized protein LOC107060444 [Solanum tuberosum]
MNVVYHHGKANIVVDALSRMYMGSVAHVEEERKELAKDGHRLARLRVGFTNMSGGGMLKVQVFSQGGDDLLRYQRRLCVPNVSELRQHILTEAHNSIYSIHQGATNMYHDHWEDFWWNGMKRDIADSLAKRPNC